MDGIGEYIDDKRELLFHRIESELTTVQRLSDTLVRPAGKLVKWVGEKVGVRGRAGSWAQLFIERLLDAELGPRVLEHDIGIIIEKAKTDFELVWEKKVQDDPPDLEIMKSLAGLASKSSHSGVGFNLEISTHVLTGGLSAALAGTFALAAGWHTPSGCS